MIQLRDDVARELHGRTEKSARRSRGGRAARGSSDTQRLLAAVVDLGVTLQPVHQGQTHPFLLTQFMIDTPDQATAEKVVERLQRLKAVEGAYVSPQPSPP